MPEDACERDETRADESCDESTASAVVSELTMHEEEVKVRHEAVIRQPSKDSPASNDTSRFEISEVVTESLPVRTAAPLAEGEDITDEPLAEGEDKDEALVEGEVADEVKKAPVRLPLANVTPQSSETRPVSESDAHISIAHKERVKELTSVSESSIVRRDTSVERTRNDICPWEDE